MAELATRPLDPVTWPDFARLVEAHNGVYGGCWCMAFHPAREQSRRTPEGNRDDKQSRVRAGEAHAALVYDDADCVGWCQFGSCDELPRIKRRREYEAGVDALPDWRITCFFVGRTHRRTGVMRAALRGAMGEVARLGGGTVEAYPEDVAGRKVSGSFLWGGTLALFESEGFARVRPLGTHHWVVRADVG